MKIKIVNGIDMRLWRRSANDDQTSYQTLLKYVCQTFGFLDTKHFRITFKDDDDTQTTIASQEDFDDAVHFIQKAGKKSLKLYIAACTHSEQKGAPVPPIQSNISSYAKPADKGQEQKEDAMPPSAEQINAFLSNDVVIQLLSDLFVSVFEALQSSNFELSFIECVQAIILSSDAKYDHITKNAIWPYFMNEVLAKKANFMVPFAVKMMEMSNKNVDVAVIKQWIPTILNMLKQHAQNGNVCGFGGCRGWRRGRRGRGRARGRGRGRGWGGYQRDFHNFGDNPRAQFNQGIAVDQDDEIEQEVFEYTEELVAIMNMGFADMQKIKKLLNENKGDKQRVIQELVAVVL